MLDFNKSVLDKGVGYYYVYDPTHSMANAAGKVYVHRYIAQQFYNVILTSDMHVHHIDENKLNNDPLNLMILSNSEHINYHKNTEIIDNICKNCGITFNTSISENRIFCTQECFKNSIRKFSIEPHELQNLVNKFPICTISKMFGVSDTAIHKRCKKFNIIKPPRGFHLRK